MNKLAIAFLASVSLFGFAGCKKKGGAAGEALGKVEGFSKQMCECKDKACADKVNDEYTKWGTEMAKNAGAAKDEKPDPDMVKKMTEAATKYTECYTKLAMAGAGMAGSGDAAGSAAAGSGDAAGSAAAGSGDAAGSAAAGSGDAAGSAAAGSAEEKK